MKRRITYEKGVQSLKKDDFFKYDKSGNRIGTKTTDSQFAPKGHNYSLPSEESVDEAIKTYEKEKNKPIESKRVEALDTKGIDRPDIKLTEKVKEIPKPIKKSSKQTEEDYFYSSGGYTQALVDELKGNDTLDTYSRRYKGEYGSKRSTHIPDGSLKYKGSYSKKTGDELPKRKSYETGVQNVAMSNNEAAVLRKLHGQNGNFGDNLEQVPLIGKGLSSAMNGIQGWGKAQYARNESIADRNMNRLSQQSWGLQEQFRPTGMRNSITNTQFGNQDYNDLEDTQNNTARKGKESVKDKALIEVEKDELIFRKDGSSPYRLIGDMLGGRTHEQGGEKVIAKEGDVIFPGKDRGLVAPLVGGDGTVIDNSKFQKLRSRLPEDKPSNLKKEQAMAKKNPNGKIIGTGMSFATGGSVPPTAKSKPSPKPGANYKKSLDELRKLKEQLDKRKPGSEFFDADKGKYDRQLKRVRDIARGSGKSATPSGFGEVKEAINESYDYWKGKAPFKQIGKAKDFVPGVGDTKGLKATGKVAGKVLKAVQPSTYINKIPVPKKFELVKRGAGFLADLAAGEAATEGLTYMTRGKGVLESIGDMMPFGQGSVVNPDGSPYDPKTTAKSKKALDTHLSNYEAFLKERERFSNNTPAEDDYVDITKPPSTTGSSNTSITIPNPASYTTPRPISAKRFGLELEPSKAEQEQVRKDLGGDYDKFKEYKVKKLRDAGTDISKYEGENDIETFYNLYHNRASGKKRKSVDDLRLEEALREEIEPFKLKDEYNDESRPPSIMRHGTKGVTESKQHESSEMKHELSEVKDFKKIDSILSNLKAMHKDITSNYKKKAEYGMRSVNTDPYAAPQSFPQNPYDNRGVQGAVNSMSNQSDTMPAFKRDIGTMGRVQSQPTQMPLSGITPTMPTMGEPAATSAKPKTDLNNLFNGKGFKSTPLGNSNSRRFSFYHGLSRQGGDEYTDRYTDVNGGGNVNQYELGIKGVKGSANNQAVIKGGGGKAPEKRVQRGVTKTKINIPGTSKYETQGPDYKGPVVNQDLDKVVAQHKEMFKGNKQLYDFYNSPEGRKHLNEKGGYSIAPPKLTTTPDTTKEIEVPTETITETPGDSGQAAISQSSSASDATGNSNSQARTTDLGNTQMGGIVDLAGAEVHGKDAGASKYDKRVASKEMRVEGRGQRRYAKGLENAYKDLEKRDDYKKSSFEQQMAMRDRYRDSYHKSNEHWLADKGLAEKAYDSSKTQGIYNIGNNTSGGNTNTEAKVNVGSNNNPAMSKQAVEGETSEPTSTTQGASPTTSPTTPTTVPANNNGVAPINTGINSSANSDVSTNSDADSGTNAKGINTPAPTTTPLTVPPAPDTQVEDERMRRLGMMAPKLRYGTKQVIGKYEEGAKEVKKDKNGNIISGANSNVTTTSTATSGNNIKHIVGPNFSGYKAGKPEDPAKTGATPSGASKPLEPGKVGDFNMPDWKKLPKTFDPAMSADDVVAGKVNLHRQNYQDTSNPQRQQIHSLMGGGGFDVGGQLAQEADKVRALDQVNAGEQQKLGEINKGNTDILNQEKLANFDQLTSARNAFEQNKGAVEGANYEALMRNNQREENHPMKEMNYNVGRANYAMMEPMMKAQMEQMRMANEYMAKRANEGTATPGAAPLPAPAPSPATTPYNPFPGTSQGGSSVPGGADMVPEAKPFPGSSQGGSMLPGGMDMVPEAPNKPRSTDGSEFLKQAGLLKRKGSKKLILPKLRK